ncbi:hypothetical protein [Streptomyces sp. NBC_00483]|jgi:hypothetical protein|uniref:hypothetical protein n=1 Tax=Streptomyces sp. NBC_00483 TaxID=2975756 RepID=UPI002E18904D
MPHQTLVWVDREPSPDHLEVLADDSLFRRSVLTSEGAQAVDEALAAIHPQLNLQTARVCAAHAGHAVAV